MSIITGMFFLGIGMAAMSALGMILAVAELPESPRKLTIAICIMAAILLIGMFLAGFASPSVTT